MNTITKKQTTPTRERREDWHPADIKCALAKKGYSFARISLEYGCRALNSTNMVLHQSWSQVEEIVAGIIGVPASRIWPSRYDRAGRPLKCRTPRISRTKTEDSQTLPQNRTRRNV